MQLGLARFGMTAKWRVPSDKLGNLELATKCAEFKEFNVNDLLNMNKEII